MRLIAGAWSSAMPATASGSPSITCQRSPKTRRSAGSACKVATTLSQTRVQTPSGRGSLRAIVVSALDRVGRAERDGGVVGAVAVAVQLERHRRGEPLGLRGEPRGHRAIPALVVA